MPGICPVCHEHYYDSHVCTKAWAQSPLNAQQQFQPETLSGLGLIGIPNTLGAAQYRDPRDVSIEDKARLLIETWDAFTTQDEPWDLAPAIEYLRRALEMR